MRTTTLVISAILLAAAPARAELTAEQKEVADVLDDFHWPIKYAKEEGERAMNHFHRDPKLCLEAVEKGKKLGIAPNEVLSGWPDNYLFKKAADKCEDYRRWHLLMQAAVIVADTGNTAAAAKSLELGDMNGDLAKSYASKGSECLTKVDALVAQGAPTDVKLPIRGEEMTLAEGRESACQALVDWGAKYSVETDKAIAAKLAAIRAKYTKHGIGGDRLELLVDTDDTYFYGKGCESKLTDIKDLKKAKLLFYWVELSDGRGWGIHRYQFKGDKLAKKSYREFSRQESAYAWCK